MNEQLITQQPSEEELTRIRAEIYECLEKKKTGEVCGTIQNCLLVFQNDPIFAGKIKRNLLTETNDIYGEMPWKRVSTRYDDEDIPHVMLFFEQYYGIKSEKKIDYALKITACRQCFHPICDYLRGLQWDGVPRVKYALHHFLGAEVNEYNETCLRTFLFGALDRIFQPGCKFDLMLVLTGGQGAGKSTFFRFLATHDEWFSDDIRSLTDKDIFQKLNGHWIMEMSEMVATANAQSIEEIKSFLSRSKDNYRFAYDRYATDHLRQCVFGGTTNRMDFLPMDRTGNRRFMPIQVYAEKAETHILADEADSRAYIDQMWAEVMVSYDAGDYETHLDREMERVLAEEQERYTQEDTLAGQIFDFMENYPGDKVCSKLLYREALDHPGDPKQWETRNIWEIVNTGIDSGDLPGWRRYDGSKRFAKFGTQRGWERIPPDEQVKVAPPPMQMHIPDIPPGFTVVTDDDDCPF